jgi:hypothetical protein
MSKNRRVKQVPAEPTNPSVSIADRDLMRLIYSIRSYAASGVFLTPIMQGNSTTVRVTFTEHNFTVNENIPVTAVTLTLENVQNIYNAIGELLNQMKAMGRIA